jgi:hypothetical protein
MVTTLHISISVAKRLTKNGGLLCECSDAVIVFICKVRVGFDVHYYGASVVSRSTRVQKVV